MTRIVTELPRPTHVREEFIELDDGCRLLARIVLPKDAERDPVPAVLEYLPYRLADGTAHNDATHHPYFAGHGYAAVRVDMRGTGSSDGVLLDEYLPQEQTDACAVIAWLAEQPWCTGAVGMFGKSWGGFNGLQVAARRPPALHAVVSAYSTDDRYADDVHYMGGCLLGHEALSWASYMLGINALPPDPDQVGERWREMWHERLRETPFFAERWLRHQRRDAFWRQGSICEDFGAPQAAILLVGGWADGYTNAVGRALTGLGEAGVPCRGLIGPWSHGWPEVADPGPRIGFLQECVRWWDHWLKGEEAGAMDVPLLRAWLQEPVAPAPHHRIRPGRWVGEDAWPSPRIAPRALFPRADGTLADAPGPAERVEHTGSQLTGLDAGTWCPYGRPADLAPDQRAEDGRSLSFTSAPLPERLEVLGAPRLEVELSSDRPRALIAARLCDVAPDGSSLLVARGLLNLTHRDGHDRVAPLEPGRPVVVSVPLDLCGHAFPAGHRVRLALSPTYWPFAWPSPEPVCLDVGLGERTRVELPVRPPDPRDAALGTLEPAERTAPAAGGVQLDSGRTLRHDVATGRAELEMRSEERSQLDADGTRFGERTATRYAIVEGRPLSATVTWRAEHHVERDGWRVAVRTRAELSSTADELLLSWSLDAFEDGVRVHTGGRSLRIPRDGV